jgi:putative ABC transport system ATP-binding protein
MLDRSSLKVAIELSKLRFSWRDDHDPVLMVEHLQINQGERVFIAGPSGGGKSTLLSLLAGVIVPQRGTIVVNGCQLNELHSAARDHFRADNIGFIYQMFNLIPYLSVVENVTLPCRFSSRRRDRASVRSSGCIHEALRLLNHLGMDEPSVINKPVTELSVGQQQRVAAARALIGTPAILIADEPTSSLDADHREAFIQLLFNECDRIETTIVFVSHDMGLEDLFDRTIQLSDINAVEHEYIANG